jgi:hypothetical protein
VAAASALSCLWFDPGRGRKRRDSRLDKGRVPAYAARFFRTMKLLACLCLTAALLAGCESDVARQGPRENPLQRGLRGEGQLIERDPLADSDLR